MGDGLTTSMRGGVMEYVVGRKIPQTTVAPDPQQQPAPEAATGSSEPSDRSERGRSGKRWRSTILSHAETEKQTARPWRYMADRERILAQQKVYRDAHKEQKRQYRLKYEFEKRYGKPYYY